MINIEVKESNKCNGEYSLFLTFPYNFEIISILREQIIRYWDPETKEWELPLKSFEDIKNKLEQFKLNIVDSKNILANFNSNR